MLRIPTATYRLQFTPTFGFTQAYHLAGYLADLGITCVYASPIFRATKGSTHGYDVVDQSHLNDELGTEEELDSLMRALRQHRIMWLQDFVPNHMAYNSDNAMLMDVLEKGRRSQFSSFFDIEWEHTYESIHGRLLAPVLGSPYGEVLENQEIKLEYDGNSFVVSYYDHRFPLRMESYGDILSHRLDELRAELGAGHPDCVKIMGLLYVLQTLKDAQVDSDVSDQTMFVKRMLREMYDTSPRIRQFIDYSISHFNGERGAPKSFSDLDHLLSHQNFRLAFWKVATEEINYRRFFSINSLISLRMQDDDVFRHTHSLVMKLVASGKIDGLRIDHIDGLYDPGLYLRRLRERADSSYIIVEKILGLDENLPDWPVQGTTGYDFTNHLTGVFCRTDNEERFDAIYRKFSGAELSFEPLLNGKKRLILANHMIGDIDNLAIMLKNISGRYRYSSDVTLYGLKRALFEVMAAFPVYRSYCNHESCTSSDRDYIKKAVDDAKQVRPALIYEIDFVGRFLLLDFEDYMEEDEKQAWTEFLMKFQQYTGPLMAKGMEDTTLYVYNRLLSLNEVGGDPSRFGMTLDDFHRTIAERAKAWPHTMNGTSTHDTKRGEDVRARINVLSELPDEWEAHLYRWHEINSPHKTEIDGRPAPDANDEYFLYQTLIGAFPFREVDHEEFTQRIIDYMMKAVREAKVHTTWLKPDTAYQEALTSFITNILSPDDDNKFMTDFLPFQQRVAHYGMLNSLSQVLIKTAAPGVPDFYQGTELWDLSLVDPDNRRPVDFKLRKSQLKEIQEKHRNTATDLITELLMSKEDGRVKLFLTHRALLARREYADLFTCGDYVPLEVDGLYARNVVAFARVRGSLWAVAIAPRWLSSVIREVHCPLGREIWKKTAIKLPKEAPRAWQDAVTDQIIDAKKQILVGDALDRFPVALLIGEA